MSARDLYDGLEIGTKFATWFPRMAEYGFTENVDYKTCYPNLGSENHDDKKRWRITTPSRGEQEAVVINESGLYALIFGSKLDSAKRFKHWVTSEVLPAIRKHGAYAVDELLNNPDMVKKNSH